MRISWVALGCLGLILGCGPDVSDKTADPFPDIVLPDNAGGSTTGGETTGGNTTTGETTGGTTEGGTTEGGTTEGGTGGEIYCPAGQKKCASKSTVKTCSAEGDAWLEEICTGGTVCAGGACKLLTCSPGEPLGSCLNDQAMEACDQTGTGVEHVYCDVAKPVCLNGECQALACSPGTSQCKGITAVEKCKDDGSGYEVTEVCGDGGICNNAKCLTACDVNVKQNTYIGCEYWVVDLDNIEAGQFQAIAAVVSNPSETDPIQVTLTNMAEGTDVPLEDNIVPPKSQRTILVPKGYDLDGTILSPNSFRIRTSGPTTVHQFNPLNADGVFSNDASLLLPANSAGKEFFVLSWPQRQADDKTGNVPLHGFATIIAVEKGETQVTVIPTSLVEHSDSFQPLTPFAENHFTLQYGQVLNLETGGGQSGPDLTGTQIISTRRITVFGGHECANIPLTIEKGKFKGAEFCDHIEQQLFPLDTWGEQYVADRFMPRSEAQTDVWRIMAGANQTVIQTDPPQPEANGITLNKGEFVEFQSGDSFFIVATGPISVGHYLKSSNYVGFVSDPECAQGEGATGIGDPAFALSVGTNQFRDSYIVLTPENYRQHFLNLMYPAGTTLTIDGEPVETPELPLGLTTWNVTTVEVTPGVHRVEGTNPVGVTAYGYDCDVSYAYPGGLNLEAQ